MKIKFLLKWVFPVARKRLQKSLSLPLIHLPVATVTVFDFLLLLLPFYKYNVKTVFCILAGHRLYVFVKFLHRVCGCDILILKIDFDVGDFMKLSELHVRDPFIMPFDGKYYFLFSPGKYTPAKVDNAAEVSIP